MSLLFSGYELMPPELSFFFFLYGLGVQQTSIFVMTSSCECNVQHDRFCCYCSRSFLLIERHIIRLVQATLWRFQEIRLLASQAIPSLRGDKRTLSCKHALRRVRLWLITNSSGNLKRFPLRYFATMCDTVTYLFLKGCKNYLEEVLSIIYSRLCNGRRKMSPLGYVGFHAKCCSWSYKTRTCALFIGNIKALGCIDLLQCFKDISL